MAEFGKIIGNQNNIHHFGKALKQGSMSHAYIISGQKGSGKKTFAESIAAGLLCEDANEQCSPCGRCPSCVKVQTANHPDLIHVTHEKPKVISVGEIREQIVENILIKPIYGPYKIYIMDDAHLMNANAQNALLKTIEEPPAYGLLFLLTSNVDGLLETVRSRCIKIDMERIPDADVTAMLTGEKGVDAETAQAAAMFARGNLGKAIEFAEGTGISELIEEVVPLMRDLQNTNAAGINECAKRMEELNTKEILELFRTWFRDVLLVKSSGRKDDLYFIREHITIKNQADLIAYENINEIFRIIDEAETQIIANVKAEAAIEAMLLKIRQHLK